jgi:glycosyltransferase involved in cell wall biosynthesis
MQPRLPVVVKGYPRLSETFIAQEILALERAGLAIDIWSLRAPTDHAVHAMHRSIAAPRHYLPEYLYQGVPRVLAGLFFALRQPGFGALLRLFWQDLLRDRTANRIRRLGQALVLARELPAEVRHIHVHYLHTPSSVVRYAARLTGRSFSFSAHAKDIFTTPDWEKREKIADAVFGVVCTRQGEAELMRCAPEAAGRVALVYHGLDLSRFPLPPDRPARDGREAGDPVRFVTVGRMVAKKGFDDLLAALALLPPGLHWRLILIGSGEMRPALLAQAERLGLADRISFPGSQPQERVIEALRSADLFVLACKEGEGGDRDGLPNVLMEAASQALPILSTRFAGVPEFVTDGVEGLLVPPSDPAALAEALARLAADPASRKGMGAAARRRVETAFSFEAGIAAIAARLAKAMERGQ